MMTEQWKRLDEALPREIKQDTDFINNAEQFWNQLSEQDQLKAFYTVVERIDQGNNLNLSYQEVLTELFGFDTSSYNIGMLCGFANIHNILKKQQSDITDYEYVAILDMAAQLYDNDCFSLGKDQTVIIEKDFSWYIAQATANFLTGRTKK